VDSPDVVAETDYGTDVTDTESHAVSTQFDPRTAAQFKKAARIGLIALAAVFLIVCAARYLKSRGVSQLTEAASTAAPEVDVVTAQSVGAVQRLVLPGQTSAWHATTIYARVNGYVASWHADIGDRVSAGDTLALIETPELDAQLVAARAQLQAADAQVQVRKAETELTRTTYERWRDSPKGVVSEQEREEKRANNESAIARLKSAEADVALDRAKVNQYVALTQFKRVTAPYDGVVSSRDIDIGNLVTAGSSATTTPLYVMTQNDPMRVFVEVPQSAAADLMEGNSAVSVQTNDGVARSFSGKVARASQALNSQARTMRVEVDIPNKERALVPGMYVKVAFALPPRGVVQIPAAALLFRAGGPQVARVDSTGKVSFRDVTIARDDGNTVELGAGVSPGDVLALNVSSQITEGEKVHIRPTAPPAAVAARGSGE
jgi:RND family efflux transporter MFP subunit